MLFPIDIWGGVCRHLNVKELISISRCSINLNSMVSKALTLCKKSDGVKATCGMFNKECYYKNNLELNFYVSIDGDLNVIEPVRIERLWKTVFNYFGTVDKHVESKIKETLEDAFNILTRHFLYPKAIPADDELLSLSLTSYRSVKYLKNSQFSHLFDQDFLLKFKDLRYRIMKETYAHDIEEL